MTVVMVQCRLSSSRLPRKALLPLGGKPLVAWTLDAMRLVPADRYILAVDFDSEAELAPVAEERGWECFAGPSQDVLDRFCRAAERAGCVMPGDLVLRATADNPFLFHEAAARLLEEAERSPSDYVTFTGLPHGSGVEVFHARSLMEACGMTDDPYDHEHVGPALYNHPENFASVMLPAPARWHHPDFRTTVDTYEDYRRAMRIVRHVSGKKTSSRPYTTEEICSAFSDSAVVHPVLCVPSVSKGRGTGHLRRCLAVACGTGADVYVPDGCGLPGLDALVAEAIENGMEDWQLVRSLPGPGSYDLVLADCFALEQGLARTLYEIAPVAAIDEGSQHTAYCDYLLDIIPSVKLGRKPNLSCVGFIPLPDRRRSVPAAEDSAMEKVLVSVGGEDPAGLSVPAAEAFAACGKNVTVIVQDPAAARERISAGLQKRIRVEPPVSNLRERLHMYDVVVTHYGFTAFEAVAAGCAVVLLGTSALHASLAQQYGFALLRPDGLDAESVRAVLGQKALLYPAAVLESLSKEDGAELGDFVSRLSAGARIPCPVCGPGGGVPDAVAARTRERTFRRCPRCGILYMSWSFRDSAPDYSSAYFLEDYKKQYGRTYLEDFAAIKAQCVRRMSVIDSIFWARSQAGGGRMRRNAPAAPSVLDIGCAMGPFLDAAADSGWQVYGTDISPQAVEYVQNSLRYPAVCAPFPDFDPAAEFGVARFDAVTMWYVIEHFRELDRVLRTVSSMLRKGGIFAFSTPSASGVSGRYAAEKFFGESPADHFTIWEPSRAASILRRYGLKVVKQVFTGHHAERFPLARRKDIRPGSFAFSALSGISRCLGLGDTFEAYCVKARDAGGGSAEAEK